MKFATFQADGTTTWGLIEGEEAVDLGSALRNRYPDLKSVIAADALQEAGKATRDAKRYALGTIEWLPVIPNPDKILCVGLNYEMHRKETGRAEVENPTI